MPKSNKPDPFKPSFTTGGSFQALAVDAIDSDSDSDPPPFSNPPPPTSTSTKKGRAKQRARDRARKSAANNPLETLPSASEEAASQTPSQTPGPDSSAATKPLALNGTKLRSGKTVPSLGSVPATPIQPTTAELTPKAIERKQLYPPDPPLALSPTSSSSLSVENSITSSPSTTDLDEDEDDYEESAPSGCSAQSKTSRPNSLVITTETSVPVPGPTHAQQPHHKLGKINAIPNTPLSAASTIRSFMPESIKPSAGTTKPLAQKDAIQHPKSTELQPPLEPNLTDAQYGADHAPGKKWQAILTRVLWSLVMVGGFVGLMTLGHVYLIVLVFVIQLSVFREVTNLFQVGYKASAREHLRKQVNAHANGHRLSAAAIERKRLKDVDNDRWSKVMSWYFFCAVNYFLYGESIIYYFKHIVFIDAYLLPFARHHRFISLLLYLIGFLSFVANLDRGHLRRQFGLFSWIHMSLLLIVASGQFMVNNILEGMIWLWVPASLVIMNDVAAYVFGMMFGRHQLIKLSPKKTVEGFVGGYFATVIFAVLWGTLFMGWNYMICPVRDLGATAFSPVECVPNDVFVWRAWELQPGRVFWWTPFQIHCMVLGTFAGLVAPFGGFFASGFKRAFGIKDFADTIPGHGGLTDRFDCQFLMGLFTHFYYTSMVREQRVSIGNVLEIIASSLNSSEQLELYEGLGRSLIAQGLKHLPVD